MQYNILISKPHHDGICGVALPLIENYMFNRYQVVNVGRNISNKLQVKHSVPQGSTLCSLIFLIYINYIITIVHTRIMGLMILEEKRFFV